MNVEQAGTQTDLIGYWPPQNTGLGLTIPGHYLLPLDFPVLDLQFSLALAGWSAQNACQAAVSEDCGTLQSGRVLCQSSSSPLWRAAFRRARAITPSSSRRIQEPNVCGRPAERQEWSLLSGELLRPIPFPLGERSPKHSIPPVDLAARIADPVPL